MNHTSTVIKSYICCVCYFMLCYIMLVILCYVMLYRIIIKTINLYILKHGVSAVINDHVMLLLHVFHLNKVMWVIKYIKNKTHWQSKPLCFGFRSLTSSFLQKWNSSLYLHSITYLLSKHDTEGFMFCQAKGDWRGSGSEFWDFLSMADGLMEQD